MTPLGPFPRTLMPQKEPAAASLGQNIRNLRAQRGWTQDELAKHLDVRKSQVGNYEGGWSFPSVPVLKKLSEAFGVSIDALVYGEDAPENCITDKDLFEFFKQVDRMDYRSKFIIREMIEGQLAKAKLEQERKKATG